MSRSDRQVKRALSDAFAFVRSEEISASLGEVTFDHLLVDALAQLDSDTFAEDQDTSTVDSTGRALFTLEGEEGRHIRREGQLQQLASLAGRVLSKSDFESLGFENIAWEDVSPTEEDTGLFDLLREEGYEQGVDELAKLAPEDRAEDELIEVPYVFTLGGKEVKITSWVPEAVLTDEEKSELDRTGKLEVG